MQSNLAQEVLDEIEKKLKSYRKLRSAMSSISMWRILPENTTAIRKKKSRIFSLFLNDK